MEHVKAPAKYDDKPRPWIFLSGGIERDVASWQHRVVEKLSGLQGTVLNPLRTDWDSSWKQELGAQPFDEQVAWEQRALREADIVLFHFVPSAKCPITLFEFGVIVGQARELEFTASRRRAWIARVVVSCPPGFWARGNVQIALREYAKTTSEDSIDDAVAKLADRVLFWHEDVKREADARDTWERHRY